MKFSCDSCGAQYMISDEKVGANGVKVRCKKCSHVIVLRRPPAEVPGDSAAAAPRKERGLDEELGQAFDAAFGGGQAAAEKPASDTAATQLMGPEDLAKMASGQMDQETRANGATASQPAAEWYVAIRDNQVGPLGTAAVKEKWQAGEIGPDSLVWKPGMADWNRLSSVGELSNLLSPLPRPSSTPKLERSRPTESRPAAEARPGPADGASADADWKPTAGSALAALASEELSVRSSPTPQRKNHAAASPVPTNGARSLVDAMNLPDGGVDPTGAIPLQMKGGGTGESTLKHKSSVARDSDELRLRRHTTRMILTVSTVLLILVGAGVGYVIYTLQKIEGNNTGTVVASNTPAGANPAAVPARPAPAVAPATRDTSPAPVVPAPATRQPEAKPAQPAPVAAVPKPAPTPPQPVRVAEAPHRAPPPAPSHVPPPPKPPKEPKRVPDHSAAAADTDAVPDIPEPKKHGKTGRGAAPAAGSSDDKAFEDILNGAEGGKPEGGKVVESGGRHIVIPGELGSGGGNMPDTVSSADIQEAVAGRRDALANCMSEQSSRGGGGGTLTMGWNIGPDGRPKNVRCLTSEFSGQPIANCFANVVKGIHFPKSKSGKSGVQFPFKF